MSFHSRNRGFTIFEMMVSVAVMIAISTMIAANQSHFSSGAALKSAADNLGLSLRQAQVYGISVKEFSPGSSNFNVGYGVDFNLSAPPLGSNNEYVFFADRSPQNSLYDSAWSCPTDPASECLDKTSIGVGNTISSICSIDINNNEVCTVKRLDITFIRPAIEAKIYFDGVSAGAGMKGVRIKMASADGKSNAVVVYVTGQISIQ